MKANELRIGNWIYHNDEVRQVTPNTISELFEADRSWCKPISLTEEWLERFGFKKQENGWMQLETCKDWLYIYWERLAGVKYSVNKESAFLPHIQFVHQLQNLCFALTGEELLS